MIDIDPESTCRICLEDGAIYPIFESNEQFDGLYAKLASCIREKIENIEGYPKNICLKCKNTSDTIYSFVSKFEETCKILKKKIVMVKTEQKESINLSDDDMNNDDYNEPLAYELEIDNMPLKPKPEKRDPTELLESLKHLTVKKIKVEDESGESSGIRKRGRPRKHPKVSPKALKPPKVTIKPVVAKKPVKAAPVKMKKTEVTPPPRDIVAEKALRAKNSDIKVKEKESKNDLPDPTVLCDMCGAIFDTKHLLGNHIRYKHSEKKFKCHQCPKAFYTQDRLNYHLKYHEEREHICELCGKSFAHKKILNGHIRYVHDKIRKPRQKCKCQYCERTFASKRMVLIHERSVHTGERPEVCSVCDGRFYDIVYLKQHMMIHTGATPFKCPICDRGYSQLCNMKSHMRNHKISDQSPQFLSTIKPSYLKFMRPLAKIKELIRQKKERLKERGEKAKNRDVTIQMKEEPKEDESKSPEEKHPEPNHLCHLCGATFKKAERLAYHRRHTHTERNFKCTKCPRAFLTQDYLNVHVKRLHDREVNVTCDICGKGFYSKTELKTHIGRVHSAQKKYTIYQCGFCEKTFRYKRGAIIHERSHTGERPATCEVCGGTFLDEVYLAEHMRLHTGETPHKCPVCGRGYAQRCNMKSHMRNHRISDLPADILAKIKPSYYKFMKP